MRNRMAMVGLTIIVFWVFLAVFAPLITDISDRSNRSFLTGWIPPREQHFFGTDELGRDVYSRVLYGARISVPVGLLVIGFSFIVGSVLGRSPAISAERQI